MTMNIGESLRVKSGEIAAFIGAGGKTTLMFRLGKEIAASGKVLITTTTKIYHPSVIFPNETFSGAVVVASTFADAVRELQTQWQEQNIVVLGSGQDQEQKLLGIPADWLPLLHSAFPQSLILVEADGAAGRLLKGHLPHEPAVPPAATMIVSVASLAALRRPLDAKVVHRPEIVAEFAGVEMGDLITPNILAQAVGRGARLAMEQATAARQLVWLNTGLARGQAAGDSLVEARMVARYLAPLGVLIGEGTSTQSVQELWPAETGVVGVVLAAGLSSRLNGEKLLLRWKDKALVRHSVEALLGSRLDKVLVVVGHRSEEVRRELAGLPIEVVENIEYREGIGLSVRAAVAHIVQEFGQTCRGVMFALGDQPCLSWHTVDFLVDEFMRREGAIIYPRFDEKRGNPVIFPSALYSELLQLRGDTGGQEVMNRHNDRLHGVAVDDYAVLEDIDCREDYLKLVKREYEA